MGKGRLSAAVDFKYALLDTYKRLALTEREVMVLLMIEHLIADGNSYVTPDLLSMKMTYAPKELDDVIGSLMKKGFFAITISSKGKSKVTIKGAEEAVYQEFEKAFAYSSLKRNNETYKERAKVNIALFEDKLARPLAPIEKEELYLWFEADYTDEEIRNALLDTIRKGQKTMKAIGRTLKDQRRKDDILKEGASAVSDISDEGIDAVLEAARKLFK